MTSGKLLRQLVQAATGGDKRSLEDAVFQVIHEERGKQHHLLANDLERILYGMGGKAGDSAPVSSGVLNSIPSDKERGLELVQVYQPARSLEDVVLSDANRIAGENDIKSAALIRIAKAAGVSLEWLVTGNDPQLPAACPDLAGVPLMEPKASAGDGLIALGTQVKNYISLDPALLHQLGLSQDESFLIEASGDSMEPTIHSGEFLLCSSSVRFKKPGDGLYIIRLGEAVLVKRIRVLRADQIEIISDNKILYPSTTHTFTEGSTEFAILGKVSYILCKRV